MKGTKSQALLVLKLKNCEDEIHDMYVKGQNAVVVKIVLFSV